MTWIGVTALPLLVALLTWWLTRWHYKRRIDTILHHICVIDLTRQMLWVLAKERSRVLAAQVDAADNSRDAIRRIVGDEAGIMLEDYYPEDKERVDQEVLEAEVIEP
jgi:hypothetical protein